VDGFLGHPLFHVGDTAVTVASLVVSLLLLGGSYVLGRVVQKLVAHRLLARTHLSVGIRYVLGRFAGYLVFFLGAAMALQAIGIRVTTLAAFGAALGVGIGFGLQDVVKSFVGGLVLLIERPFQVGDRVEIEKTTAEVVEIRARTTVLRTNDDVYLVVPNSKFITETITNRTFGRPVYRCHVAVAVATDANPAAVQEALLEAAARCERILADPPPAVRFREFGESSLRFELLVWTAGMVHHPGALSSELAFLAHESLRRRGVPLPSPRVDVHVGERALPPGRAGAR